MLFVSTLHDFLCVRSISGILVGFDLVSSVVVCNSRLMVFVYVVSIFVWLFLFCGIGKWCNMFGSSVFEFVVDFLLFHDFQRMIDVV